jgi:hypothetical protein
VLENGHSVVGVPIEIVHDVYRDIGGYSADKYFAELGIAIEDEEEDQEWRDPDPAELDPHDDSPSKEAPRPDRPDPASSIPFMITQAMKAALRARGHSNEAIRELTPERAHEILAKLESEPQVDDRPDPAALEPDRDEAERHLTALDPNTNKFTFQALDDNSDRKDGRLTKILHGTLAQHFKTLVKLNNRGAGVFVCVCVTNFKGRKQENIIGVRAHFADLDGAPLEPVLADDEPKTHLITETSPGRFHPYWRVDNAPLD